MSGLLMPVLSMVRDDRYPALWVIVFLASAGIPLPVDPLLIAAGAFAGHGDFNVLALLVVAVSASVLGDSSAYALGRLWGREALDRVARAQLAQRLCVPERVDQANALMQRYGEWAVFLSRSVMGALSGVVNLLAGAQPMPYRTFLSVSAFGEVVDVVAMLAIGWMVGASWEAAGDTVRTISLAALALLVAATFLVRRRQRYRGAIEQRMPPSREHYVQR